MASRAVRARGLLTWWSHYIFGSSALPFPQSRTGVSQSVGSWPLWRGQTTFSPKTIGKHRYSLYNWSITVARLPLRSSNENKFILGVTTYEETWGAILKGHSFRKAEDHCSRCTLLGFYLAGLCLSVTSLADPQSPVLSNVHFQPVPTPHKPSEPSASFITVYSCLRTLLCVLPPSPVFILSVPLCSYQMYTINTWIL